MRRKSPAAVQKWVDSIPLQGGSSSIITTTTTLTTVTPTCVTITQSTTQRPTTSNNFLIDELNKLEIDDNNGNNFIKILEHSEGEIKRDILLNDDTDENLTDEKNEKNKKEEKKTELNKIKEKHLNKFWKRNGPFFNLKSTQHEDCIENLNADEKCKDSEKSLASNLTEFGKLKINEFYDKLNINKKRFHLIKTKRMDLDEEEIDNILKNDKNIIIKINEEIDSTGNLMLSNKTNELNDNNELIFNETLNKNQLQELNNYDLINDDRNDIYQYLDAKRIGIGEIGRSVSVSEKKNIKKLHLGDIGRSFSETKNDDNLDNFIINERNNSCPNQIINSSLNNNMNFDFINSTSQPVSPIPRNQRVEIMSRDFLLTERINKSPLLRDSSIQSDSSHCSSVESLLESRKPDPETILINLGFGPIETDNVLNKIPKRFLKPSMVKGVDTDAFVRQQKLATQVHENSVLGYRGLVDIDQLRILQRFRPNQDQEKNK